MEQNIEVQNNPKSESRKSWEFEKERKMRMMNDEEDKSKDRPLEGNGEDELGPWTSRLPQNKDQDNEGPLASLFLLENKEGTRRWKRKVPLRASQEKKPRQLTNLGKKKLEVTLEDQGRTSKRLKAQLREDEGHTIHWGMLIV